MTRPFLLLRCFWMPPPALPLPLPFQGPHLVSGSSFFSLFIPFYEAKDADSFSYCNKTFLLLSPSSYHPSQPILLHLVLYLLLTPLEKEMVTHSSILAWRIPWTDEPGGLLFMGSQKVGHGWVTKHLLTPQSIYSGVWSLHSIEMTPSHCSPSHLFPKLNHSQGTFYMVFQRYWITPLSGGSGGKKSACNAGDPGSIPGLGRSPGEGNGYPLQYSSLENSMHRGDRRAIVHGVSKSWT